MAAITFPAPLSNSSSLSYAPLPKISAISQLSQSGKDFKSNFAFESKPNIGLPRLKIFHNTGATSRRIFASSSLGDGDTAILPSSSPLETTIDLQVPRRRLIVQFTCKLCGVRTQKYINRLAYERGTVFVQCAGCERHHKLVDNLNLVVEYDLQKDNNCEDS